jgi:hypothetical protein
MPANAEKVAWIVRTALLDETFTSEELIQLMQQHGISSAHLLIYINDDDFWPNFKLEEGFTVPERDEQFILNFGDPHVKLDNRLFRQKAREMVTQRFYTGHRFSEWLI